jgi:diadenosine tetraphosphate (Ap4A) HIT family hydrolase
LCDAAGGRVIVQAPRWRLVHADEAGLPAFYRVVWNAHVREFSQLAPADRAACMDVVVEVEQGLLRHLQPAKVNLASLGNGVPHLHWHVIARFEWDSRFPGAPWAAPGKPEDVARSREVAARLEALEADLRERLSRTA